MNLSVFLDEVFVELPNEYYEDFDFNNEITALVLSHLGHFLGVGFINGEVILCDSETGNNRHKYTGHDEQVTALSFSIDNKFVASGDLKGICQVTDVLTHNVLFRKDYGQEIVNVLFSPNTNKEFLIQAGNACFVVNLDTKEERRIPDTVSLVLWEEKYGFIIVNEALELNFYNQNFERVGHNTLHFMKKIIFIAISNNGKLLCLINSKGEGIMYDTDQLATADEKEPEYREMYKDRVTETKFTCCVFDRNSEHVIFSSNQKMQCKLVIYEIDATEVKQELDGPSDPVDFLLFHPQQPVVYSCGSPSIRMWTPTYENSWEQFMPGFEHLTTNVEYIEKEDEFDIDDSVHVDKIMRGEGEKIDFFTPAKEQQQILCDLPLSIDELVKARIDAENKAAKKNQDDEDSK